MIRKIGFFSAMLIALALMTGTSMAAVVYLGDGAVQNTYGGWDVPLQGSCPADVNQLTRPDCLALRLNIVQASCVSPTYSWTTSGVCNDLVNNANQSTCEAQPDRKWNAATSVCAIVMKGDDRNNLVCAVHGGTWVTAGTCIGAWVMPARDNPAYGPGGLLTGNSPGDQCLRCHNSETEYNGARVRDVEETFLTGHKNMARKVTGTKWGGPPFHCTVGSSTDEEACEQAGGTWAPVAAYPSDDAGNVIDWVNSKITVAGVQRDLKWIYGDWLSPLPRAIYITDRPGTCSNPAYTTESTCVANGGTWTPSGAAMSYSCGRCHTTGWTSDATINTAKDPEKSFPGITWNPSALTGWINLRGGVTGDSNNFSSWDYWGISCGRCHSSAVDNTTNGGVPPFSAPTGMSSHHSNLTAADNTSGVCSDVRFTNEATCTGNSGQWLTNCNTNPTAAVCTQAITTQAACVSPGVWVSAPAWCSNAFYTDQTSCEANSFVWQAGWCTRPDKNSSTTCTGGSGTSALTWRLNGTQASCQAASATWGTISFCSVEGFCNKGVNITSKAACTTAGGQFAYATDIVRCIDAGGKWTGNNTKRGQLITALCMNCHRQETGGLPFDGGTDPGQKVTVAPYHETITFPSHPHGNQFLNSPHGKYSGSFAAIGTSTYGSGYGSFFQFEGEANNTGNGCTGCHDPHQSVVEETGTQSIHEECQECHHKDLTKMLSRHPGGVGTPLEHMTDDPMKACEVCHMPGEVHLFRINTKSTYSTFPTGVFGTYADSTSCLAAGGKLYASGVCYFDANTEADGTYTKAAWVDLDMACGQCHGGGAAYKVTKGSITTGTKVLTVTSATGISTGQRILIAGAGALGADFESYVSSVSGLTVNLVGKASTTVANATVTQNPTKNGAGYINKTRLAGFAAGMHNDAPVVSFYYQRDPANTMKVNVNASGTTCNVTCNVYDWDWGDGSAHGSGVTASHTYAVPGRYAITLTVTEYGVGTGSKTQYVSVYAADLPPVIGGNTDCATIFNLNNWTGQINDASTDDHGVFTVRVTWGDGSLTQNGPAGTVFTHTYPGPGTYNMTRTVYDTIMQQTTQNCTVVLSRFAVRGAVYKHDGVTPVPSATLRLVGTGYNRTLLSDTNGFFAFANLKPGAYTLTIIKTGYTFPVIPPITVGPNSNANYPATTP